MAYYSVKAEDGTQPIKVNVQTGWYAGFGGNQWQPTSTYTVAVSENESFKSLIDKLKEQTGPTIGRNVDQLYGVDKMSGKRVEVDASKTVKENGITHVKQLELRFPNTTQASKGRKEKDKETTAKQ
eukprot:TRINITY_DN3999_c0_g2_i1.p1 TRINITY_DN3999_c0_g2~~TRINITY_DN3999_c0_g2_i1.p1  ORF type:complete len:126 (-),score=29.31 TRINITY_DN3999_c0_g2_i1:147-524(-)